MAQNKLSHCLSNINYLSSVRYSISVPSKDTVTTTPLSYTLVWSSTRSIKSISSSCMGCACSVSSIKSTARNLASKFSPCTFSFHSGRSASRHFSSLFHAMKSNLPLGILIYMTIWNILARLSLYTAYYTSISCLSPQRCSANLSYKKPCRSHRKWILFRIVRKRIYPMLFQVPFPAFHLQLCASLNPLLNDVFMVILNIKLLYFPVIHHTLLSFSSY